MCDIVWISPQGHSSVSVSRLLADQRQMTDGSHPMTRVEQYATDRNVLAD